MNDDDLRDRLRRIDPASSELSVEPPTSPSARARLERTMQTQLPTDHGTDAATPGRRNRWLLGAAAAVLVVAGIAAAVIAGDDDTATDVATGPPLELSLGAGDTMASCLAPEARFLADVPVAFAGTATAVEADRVTLTVDRWYTGGDAEVVELQAMGGQVALTAGFEFETGQPYLVSATDGTVNFCGLSGPVTPELQSLFDEAFPS